MAQIITYPKLSTLANNDLLIVSDVSSVNKTTNSLEVDTLAQHIIVTNNVITGGGTIRQIPMFTPTGVIIGDSIMRQSLGNTEIQVGGSLAVTSNVNIDQDLDVSGNVNIQSLSAGYLPVPNYSGGDLEDSQLQQSPQLGNGLYQMKFRNADRFIIDKPSSVTTGDPEYLIQQDGNYKVSFGWDDDGAGFGYIYNWAGNGLRLGAAGQNPQFELNTVVPQIISHTAHLFDGTAQFEQNIQVNAAIEDGLGNTGTAGQVLSSTVTGVEWVSNGGGTVTGTGTTNTLPLWSDGPAGVLGDSPVVYDPVGHAGAPTVDIVLPSQTFEFRDAGRFITGAMSAGNTFNNATLDVTGDANGKAATFRGGVIISTNPGGVQVDNTSLVVGGGNNDNVTGSDHCLIVGNGNQILSNSDQSVAFGQGNTITSSTDSLAVGNSNNINSAQRVYALGFNNSITSASSFVAGGDNSMLGGNTNIMVGYSNSSTGSNTFAIGNDITVNNQTMVLGFRNDLASYPLPNKNLGLGDTKFVVAVGSGNTTPADNNAVIITEGGINGGSSGLVPQRPRIFLPQTLKLNAVSDALADAIGVPEGGVYNNNGILQINKGGSSNLFNPGTSTSVGTNTITYFAGLESMAIGSGNTVLQGNSLASGNNCTSNAFGAFAGGGGSQANGIVAIAYGNNVQANGINSAAFGGTTTASGNFSFAVGDSATASGQNSMALGGDALAQDSLAGPGVTVNTADYAGFQNLLLANYASLNYTSDAAAAAGGVPLGGIYHNAGDVKIRLV